MNKTWHKLSAVDVLMPCTKCSHPATQCEQHPYKLGDVEGITFWYYCDMHAHERRVQEGTA